MMRGVFKVVGIQAVMIVFAAGVFGLAWGRREALSALLGGLAYWLPNLWFARRLSGWRTPGSAAVSFMIAEGVKLVAVALLLAVLPQLVSRWVEVYWPAVVAGLIVVLIINLFVLTLKI